MPKRAVTEPTSTKKKAKKARTSNEIPPLPTDIHLSQQNLVDKAIAQRDKELAVIITGRDQEPGLGKTYVAGAFLRSIAEKEVAAGQRVLVIYVSKTAELAKDQAYPVGAKVERTPFQLSKTKTLVSEIDCNGMACISITRTSLRQLFHFQKEDKIAPKMPALIQELNIDTVLLCLDEVHEFYKTDKLATAVASMRKQVDPVKIEVIGMTATPELHVKGCRDNATTLFGFEDPPEPVVYSKKEHAALLKSLKHLPNAPKNWLTIDLGSPIGNALCTSAIAQLKRDVIAFFMAPENGKSGSDGARMQFRARIASTLAKTESMLASGGDGGKFMEAVRPLVSVKRGGAGDTIDAKQSVLIGYQNSSAAVQHKTALETNNEDECNIFALGSGGYGEQTEAMESMLESFRSNDKITLGFTAKSQHSGHDKFAKIATTIVAIGSKWTHAQKTQFFGRVGRIGAKIEWAGNENVGCCIGLGP